MKKCSCGVGRAVMPQKTIEEPDRSVLGPHIRWERPGHCLESGSHVPINNSHIRRTSYSL